MKLREVIAWTLLLVTLSISVYQNKVIGKQRELIRKMAKDYVSLIMTCRRARGDVTPIWMMEGNRNE